MRQKSLHGSDKQMAASQSYDTRSSYPSIRGVSLGKIDPRENTEVHY